MDDLDDSGFVLDKNSMKCETLDPNMAKGVVKIIPRVCNREIDLLDDNSTNRNAVCSQADTDHRILRY